MTDQIVQLFVAADIQFSKPLEELRQILDGRIAEDFGFAVCLASQPFSQMGNQTLQFFDERGLGKLNGFVKSTGNPFAFLAIDFGVQLSQVVRRFDAGKIRSHLEHTP